MDNTVLITNSTLLVINTLFLFGVALFKCLQQVKYCHCGKCFRFASHKKTDPKNIPMCKIPKEMIKKDISEEDIEHDLDNLENNLNEIEPNTVKISDHITPMPDINKLIEELEID